jgi:DNA-binding NtrC family response regulator
MAARVLIVDDDPNERAHLEKIIRSLGHLTESAGGGESALERVARPYAPPISAMILDLVMPDLDGMAVLERLRRSSVNIPVIVQTKEGGSDAAGSAMRLGAFDFLVKPATAQRITVSIANALKLGALKDEVTRMRRSRSGTLGFTDIVSDTPTMERVLRLGERAARAAGPALIEGERGVGKEIFARAIHGSSSRRARAFVMMRCEGTDRAYLDSVLFGKSAAKTKGAGAPDANGGTLYLEEISALGDEAQAALATFLDTDGRRDTSERNAPRRDIRVIASTSCPLIGLVTTGAFREDLFYRLSVMSISLPPLRERRGEIPYLAHSVLGRLAAEEGRSNTRLSTAACELLCAYEWPGNFRELENAIFRALMLGAEGELSPQHFPHVRVTRTDRLIPARQSPLTLESGESIDATQPREDGPAEPAKAIVRNHYGVARLLDEGGQLRRFEALEEEVIRFAIDHYRGRMSEVARRLGIGRSTLYRKLREYGITAEEVLP